MIEVKLWKDTELGVFAIKNIAKGTEIWKDYCMIAPACEGDVNAHSYEHSRNHVLIALGPGSFLNMADEDDFGDSANIKLSVDFDNALDRWVMDYVATEDIKKGDQLLISY